MKRCDHDKVYSGQINLSQRFAWICRKCGECGWAEDYVLAQVDLQQYHHLRVLHGWAGPPRPPARLPPPPRVPTNTDMPRSSDGFVWGVAFFVALAATIALSGWNALGPVLPTWAACVGTGLALGAATLLYVVWKRGSNG